MEDYDFRDIESKWQKKWEDSKTFEAKEKGDKYYVLGMYPYPSGSGLHMGHAFNYTIADILARYKRMKGLSVLHPMGFDSFGLPAENAAIKNKSHPKLFTDEAINNFIRQLKAIGLSYDWNRRVQSHDPNYYRWNQFIFLQLYKKGLIYRKKANVNWCPECNTVLANEQVHNGKCWRHTETDIQIKSLEQWFVKTTDYADELVKEVDSLDWPDRIKIMQKNWIGRSEGSEILFEVNGEDWPIFTTRADTLMGVTFLVVSAQHPRLMELVTKENKKEIDSFLKKVKSTSEKDNFNIEKEGVFTGSYAVHPITKEKIPIWAGNFVVADYGSGMVMAVPAHDQRDFDFAKKYDIPLKFVIDSDGKTNSAYTKQGVLINSGKFDGLESLDAKDKITSHLEKMKKGKKIVQYKLRDWLVSRQRYWGTPIPMIHCDKCGVVPVDEKDLPVLLPEKVKFGEGNPLLSNKEFLEVSCPNCNCKARRETDTMDTFFDSSWYYLRFTDSLNDKLPFSKKNVSYWMPVDFYTGGAEHACMHLIYARFFTKALRDLGFLEFDEPFTKLFNQGMIHGEDGVVMSKSRGNVVDPLEISNKYGADSLRLFLISVASPDKDFAWSSTGIQSTFRLVNRIYEFLSNVKEGKSSKKNKHKVNLALRGITQDIEDLSYNLASIKIRSLFEGLEDELDSEDIEKLILMISPFCPHISEELWSKRGNKKMSSLSTWPEIDESKIDENIEKAEKNFESLVSDVNNLIKMVKDKQGKDVEKVYVYSLPNELVNYDSNEISKRVGREVLVYAVNDKDKHDPQSKSSKAKPGKPGLYLE